MQEQPLRSSRCVQIFGLMLLVAASLAPAAAGQPRTPFGSFWVPAHAPLSTPEDSVQALLEMGALGDHGSYMWDWHTGNGEIADLRTFVNFLDMLGMDSFLQVNPAALGVPAPPAGYQSDFSNFATRARFLGDVTQLAGLRPDYLNLGAEINFMAHLQPQQFNHYASLFREAYRIVKQISPNTKVGVSHHLDLFFGERQFDLLQKLGPQDFYGFTTYPAWWVYQDFFDSIEDIPEAMYTRIRNVAGDKPVVLAEVGWPSGGRGNLQDQADFVAALPRLLRGVKPELITWSMLHDVSHFREEILSEQQLQVIRDFGVNPTLLFQELNSMGILSWDGPPKPAFLEALELDFSVP